MKDIIIYLVWLVSMSVVVSFACSTPAEDKGTKMVLLFLVGVVFGLAYYSAYSRGKKS